MICLLSLLVFGILGIFSASHRALAAEAFDCVTRRVKREPCETDLEDRVKASVIGKTLDYSPRAAKILSRHFELFSWVLLIALLLTGAYSAFSLFNYVVYGYCAGAAAQGGCSLEAGSPLLNTAVGSAKSLAGVTG
ncbi:MAG: hypothetical protein ABEJ62_00790 [Candidatus Nanohaloarchaea archaeon]